MPPPPPMPPPETQKKVRPCCLDCLCTGNISYTAGGEENTCFGGGRLAPVRERESERTCGRKNGREEKPLMAEQGFSGGARKREKMCYYTRSLDVPQGLGGPGPVHNSILYLHPLAQLVHGAVCALSNLDGGGGGEDESLRWPGSISLSAEREKRRPFVIERNSVWPTIESA